MTRSLVACLTLSVAAAMIAAALCIASGGGALAALGLYVVTGLAVTLLSTGLLAALRSLSPAPPPAPEAPVCA